MGKYALSFKKPTLVVALIQSYTRHRADLLCIEFTFSEAIKALKLLFAYVNCELVSTDVLPENWFFLLCECNIYFLLLKRRQHEGFQLEGETFL